MKLYKYLTKRPFLDGMLRGVRLGRNLEHTDCIVGLRASSKVSKFKSARFRDGYLQAISDLEKKDWQKGYEFYGEDEEEEEKEI